MSRIDKFLYAGEKAIYSLAKESPFGAEELAATDRRAIHVKGDKFYGIKYESLVSLGCYINRSQKKDAFDFVKIVRAAEAGIVKPHKSIKPEVIEPEQRSLEVFKPTLPRPQPKDKLPRL